MSGIELFEHFVAYRPVGDAYRPLLMAEFSTATDRLDFLVLVDTGADTVVLPYAAMELLGIEDSQCETTQANTSQGIQYGFHSPPVAIALPDLWPEPLFQASVVFTPWLDGRTYGLLGREPSLDYLRFAFGHDIGFGFSIGRIRDVE